MTRHFPLSLLSKSYVVDLDELLELLDLISRQGRRDPPLRTSKCDPNLEKKTAKRVFPLPLLPRRDCPLLT